MDAGYFDLYASPDAATAQERAAALQAGLRRDQGMGFLGMLSGDPGMARLGQAMEARGHQGNQLLAQAPDAMAQTTLRNQQAAAVRSKDEAMASPIGRRMLTKALAALAPEMANDPEMANAPSQVLGELLGPAQHVFTATQAAEARKYAADQARLARGEVAAASAKNAAGTALTPEALDMVAKFYAKTGQLPPLGMGAAAAGQRATVLNKAASQEPGVDVASNKSGYNANSGSLTALQKQTDAMNAFEATAGKNLDQFLGAAKGVVDSGSPLLNKPLRSFDQGVLGKPEMTAFNVARQVAVTEIAKVLSNPGLSGQLSDSARHEVQQLIGPDATLAQIYQAAGILRTDMANRRTAMDEQLAQVRGRISGTPPPPAAGGTVKVRRKSDGKMGSLPAANFNPAIYEQIQ